MRRYLVVFAVAGVLAFGAMVYAHHSIAATYDGKKEVKLTGKIVEFDFRNPHAFVHIEAPDSNGGHAALGRGVGRSVVSGRPRCNAHDAEGRRCSRGHRQSRPRPGQWRPSC